MLHVGAKATDNRTHSKAHGVRIYISVDVGYSNDGDKFLDRIIADHETWVAAHYSKVKQ